MTQFLWWLVVLTTFVLLWLDTIKLGRHGPLIEIGVVCAGQWVYFCLALVALFKIFSQAPFERVDAFCAWAVWQALVYCLVRAAIFSLLHRGNCVDQGGAR